MKFAIMNHLLLYCFLSLLFYSSPDAENLPIRRTVVNQEKDTIISGAEQTDSYLPYIKGKKIAVFANQTSRVGDKHLIDTLSALGIQIQKIFSPEHGFRGSAEAGEKVMNGKDPQTGTPIISLYGDHKKPSAMDLAGIDVIIFDIQDVGARFYTYI